MTTWHINAVRVPLNEDCWLGINHVKKRYSGEMYRSAVEAVQRLHDASLYVILDLHWNAPGTQKASVSSSRRTRTTYLGWSWNVTSCKKAPSLISNAKKGTPTDLGIGLRDHLRALAGAP